MYAFCNSACTIKEYANRPPQYVQRLRMFAPMLIELNKKESAE
jgi:hypothetical protein